MFKPTIIDYTSPYATYQCTLKVEAYSNGRTALCLIDAEDGSPVCTATINVPEVELKPNEVIIKNYSENEGILDVLVNAGIVTPTGRYISIGYVSCPVCIIDPNHLCENEFELCNKCGVSDCDNCPY